MKRAEGRVKSDENFFLSLNCETPNLTLLIPSNQVNASFLRDFSFTIFHAIVRPVIDDLFHVLIARMHKLGVLQPETNEPDQAVQLKVSLSMLRFHQILRPNESFHGSVLFAPISLIPRY